jgi:hypothetical protein
MFEILICPIASVREHLFDRAGSIACTTSVHRSVQAHILAVCPTIHLSKSTLLTAHVRENFRLQRRNPRQCLGRGRRNTIVATRSVNACRENFFRSKPSRPRDFSGPPKVCFWLSQCCKCNGQPTSVVRRSSSTAAEVSRRFESDQSGPISDGRIMLPKTRSVKRRRISRSCRLDSTPTPQVGSALARKRSVRKPLSSATLNRRLRPWRPLESAESHA